MNKNILTGYQNELKKLNKARAQIKELPREYDFRSNNRERLQAATPAERETILNEIRRDAAERDAIIKENEKTTVKIKCLEHNAEIIFCREIYPLLIDVLTPYFGKSYGEKTKEKTRNEFKNRYNMSFYFKDDREIVVILLTDAGYSYKSYSVHASYNTPFLTDNRLNDFNNIELITYKRPYIENVNKHVNDLFKAYDAAKTAYENFKNKADIYGALSVDGLQDINTNCPHFYGII